MSVEIRVPQLGESVVEGTILRWLKQAGETVTSGEPVVELETDKVNVEILADAGGVLERITRREGETVAVGDVLGVISGDGQAPVAGSQSSVVSSQAAGAGQQAPGGTTPESALTTHDSRLTTAESPVPAVDYGGRTVQQPESGHQPSAINHQPVSPVARKLAEENNVDLRLVTPSGPGGKITKEDVTAFLESRAGERASGRAGEGATPESGRSTLDSRLLTPETPVPAPDYGSRRAPGPLTLNPQPSTLSQPSTPAIGRPEERVRMSRRRQTIAARLVEAQHTAAMLTTFNEADMSAIMEIRKKRRDAFKERFGVGLGFMSFFTKAVVGALKAFPYLNAEIQGDEIVVKQYYDIGVAVSTEEGLVVPVLRDADKKSFAEIEKGIADLAARARDGKLTLPELQGGTFTVTNGGVFGSLMSTPILNTPQVGILGMHKIQERPVVVDGQIMVRPMMYLALSYDHRIVDGSEAVRFLVRVKELVEDPASLLLEG